jgi:hypothetical protein
MLYELAHLYHIGLQQQNKKEQIKKQVVTKTQTRTYQTKIF